MPSTDRHIRTLLMLIKTATQGRRVCETPTRLVVRRLDHALENLEFIGPGQFQFDALTGGFPGGLLRVLLVKGALSHPVQKLLPALPGKVAHQFNQQAAMRKQPTLNGKDEGWDGSDGLDLRHVTAFKALLDVTHPAGFCSGRGVFPCTSPVLSTLGARHPSAM